MSIEKVYDNVVKHYSQDLSAHVLGSASKTAFDLLKEKKLSVESIFALGIGDGEQVIPYIELYPKASVTGLDISSRMLEAAHQRLNCDTKHGDIAHAEDLVKPQKFDLAIAHFVCAYVEPDIVMQQAVKTLNDNGTLSIVSNTMQSFAKLLSYYHQYVEKDTYFRRHFKKHIEAAFATVHVPDSHQILLEQCQKNNLDVLSEKSLKLEIRFETVDEFHQFFMNAGWFASGLLHSKIAPKLIKFFFKWIAKKHLSFPFEDTLDISVVLARK